MIQSDEQHVQVEDPRKGTGVSFRGDKCFGGAISQTDMFVGSGVINLIEASMSGYPTCVFAYGQTGAGKTHTVIGNEDLVSRKRKLVVLVGCAGCFVGMRSD